MSAPMIRKMDVQNINKSRPTWSRSCEASSRDDSDSSDNAEEYCRLREAAVKIVPTTSASSKVHATLPPSLRTSSEEVNEYRHDLDTTPEFRAHVAKKLTQIIDKSVDMIQPVGVPPSKSSQEQGCSESRESDSPGVKLFAVSNQTVAAVFALEMPTKKKLKRLPSSSDSDSDAEMARFASAAVSGKDILRQAKETPLWISKVVSDLTETTGKKNVETESAGNPVGNVNGHSNEKGTLQSGDELNVRKNKKRNKKHKGGLEADEKPVERLTDTNSTGLESDIVHLVENKSVADKPAKKIKTKCDTENDDGVDSLKVGVLAGEDGSRQHGAKKKKKQKLDVDRLESATSTCHMYGKKKKCKHRHSEKM